MNPNLRFKKTNNSQYKDYEKIKLKEILVERNVKQCIEENAKLLSFTIEEGIIEPEKKKTNKRDFLTKDMEHKKYLLTELNDIIYNPSNIKFGAIGRNKLRRGVVSPVYKIFSTSENPAYIELLLKTQKFINKTLKYLEGTVIKLRTLKPDDFLNIDVSIPEMEEQEKIGNFFEIFDKKISLQEEKIIVLENIKKKIMSEFFENNLVDSISLSELAKIEKGKQKNASELSTEGKYYLLNGGINPSGYLDEYNTNENTITISEGGSSCGYINYNEEKFWCGGHCYKVINSSIDNKYLFYLLKYHEPSIMKLRVGSGLPNIQKKDLENYIVQIHDEEIQKDIVKKMDVIELKIKLENDYLTELKKEKISLCQNMFV